VRDSRGGSALALALLAGAALAGCSGHHATPAPGTVTGTLIRVGGPAPGAAVPLPGHVIATSSAGARFSAAVPRNGQYRLSLPPGAYRLTGYSPLVYSGGSELRCVAARTVHLASGQTAPGVDVVCSIP
jgi:hypothetical protein